MSALTDIAGSLPTDSMRVVFLYVGQGESTLLLVPDGGGGHLSLLVDCNRSESLKGIDAAAFLVDTLGKDRPLDAFANTHPHKDHLCGLAEIAEAVTIKSVWHSGHKPSKAHEEVFGELRKVIDGLPADQVRQLLGSRTPFLFGLAEIHVVAPAQYVCDDIAGEGVEARDRRIHEHCAVFRVSFQGRRLLITGDADKTAWKQHITDYHGKPNDNRIGADVLSASHHGSDTFFRDSSEDPEPYFTHLERIAPKYVVISAPDRKDSPHGHPDAFAWNKYEERVGADGMKHMSSKRHSFILDVHSDGTFDLFSDRGEIASRFGLGGGDGGAGRGGSGGDSGGGAGARAAAIPAVSRVERSRPMGS